MSRSSGRAARLAPVVSPLATRHAPLRGLTLVELLVTIVIMVTVLAGVIPLISPNNDARKIREASRQLSSMLAQAQAQAQREGRPAGVAFREAVVGGDPSGMALEAYFVAEPRPFAGFSENSRLNVQGNSGVYGSATGSNGGTRFVSQYDGYQLCTLNFVLAGGPTPIADAIPPRMMRIGDMVYVSDGNVFLICDDRDETSAPNQVETMADGSEFLLSNTSNSTSALEAIWVNRRGQALARSQGPEPPLRQYTIVRQPANTSDAPLQFPRGIGIDTRGSGTNLGGDFDSGGINDVVAIMFGPSGSLSDFYFNNRRVSGVERIFLLLGPARNGNANFDSTALAADDDALLDQRRRQVNWMHPEARWVTIGARSGRVVASDNYVFNPFTVSNPAKGDFDQDGDGILIDRQDQIHLARNFARDLKGSGGR
jgi:type II secretory pathway pseudopilin PulG